MKEKGMSLIFTDAIKAQMEEGEQMEVLIFLYRECPSYVVNIAEGVLREITLCACKEYDISMFWKKNSEIFHREFSSLMSALGYEITQKDEQCFVSVPT